MTIKEFAKNYSITPQAVYQKLKVLKIPLDSVKKGNSQELTEEGIKKLESIFLKKSKEETESIERLKIENEFLKNQIKELKAERDKWAEIAKTAQESLQREQQATHQAQAIQMATIQNLGAKKSWWARITGKTGKEQQ